ncbi:MAG: S9 family peptidase [Crocinitomicaceae bacterium]
MNHPSPKKLAKSLVAHGHERIDNYFWMNDRENPEVITHLNAENDYLDQVLADTKADQELLFNEMKGRIKEDDSSVPYFKNGYWYYSRYETGKEYPIHCRKKDNLDAEEIILIDENLEAVHHPYYDVVAFAVTRNNKIMAFAEDITGRRMYRLRFKNLETNEIIDHEITDCGSDMAWHNDNEQLYFSVKDKETLRPHKILVHNFITNQTEEVFEEKDDTYICGVSIAKDFGYLTIGSYSTLTTEFQFKSAHDDSPFEYFIPREKEHEYYVELLGETAFIKTNKKAENFRLVSCPINKRGEDNWKVIQGHSLTVYLEDFEVFKDFIVLQEKENGLSRLRVFDLAKAEQRIIPPFEETYTLYLGTNPEIDSLTVRIGYSSMTTPHSVYDVNLLSFEKVLRKQQEVLGSFIAEDYQSERIWAKAQDDTLIPASVVYHKAHFKKDGTNPILIYAYGSYGSTVDPYFSSARLSLLNRGFVFVIAHIRGGEYLGHQWYENGKLLKKKNTFTDFIDVAEYLAKEGYCNPAKRYAMGGSAGGLLMGAISNMRPEIWKGIISAVPFVDVISTMLDDTIPLTTGEYDEWGNPNDKTYYDYMLSYSPYDNIEAKDYPAMLVTSGLHDSQVQYWEPTKYVAKLRELKTDNNPVLLKTNMDAGHGGASGRFEALKEVALEYAFMLWLEGMTPIKDLN